MKKIISSISAFLVMLAVSSSFTSIAKSAEFFTIGTGGPTGVYFQTGNAICKMLHKQAIAKEHGRKKGIDTAYRCFQGHFYIMYIIIWWFYKNCFERSGPLI